MHGAGVWAKTFNYLLRSHSWKHVQSIMSKGRRSVPQVVLPLPFIGTVVMLGLLAPHAAAQNILDVLNLAGQQPYGLTVNSATNNIYLGDDASNTVTVINGANNSTAAVPLAGPPVLLAVNPVTNKIYVSTNNNTVTVIDGATNATTPVATGPGPDALAVNSITNKIYVANIDGNSVTVIDGATNQTTPVNLGTGIKPYAIDINPVTNKIYVANQAGNSLMVIDGLTNSVTSVPVGANPTAVAVNSVTNQIYVANGGITQGTTVSVIDGATNLQTATVTVGTGPESIAVNPLTNKIYVGNQDTTVTVIDGATNLTTPVTVGSCSCFVNLAVNPVTNKIYAVDGPILTIIDGTTNTASATVSIGTNLSTDVAVNPLTNRVYATNAQDGTVYVIAGASAPPLQFVRIAPCRVADTRGPDGTFGGPALLPGSPRAFPIPQSACNIPPDAAAYSLNVTVVPHGALGFLTVWPSELTQPFVSTLNSFDGRTKANAAIVPAGANGGISVFASNTTDLVLDINGYFVSGSGLAFYTLPPCRVLDTRNATGPLGGPSLVENQARTFPVTTSSCNIPATAQAYSLNVTAVPHGPLFFLSVWPDDQSWPGISTLNAPRGGAVANGAIVPAGPDGGIQAMASNDTDMVVDINGYFAPPGTDGLSLYATSPCRVLDTRSQNGSFKGDLVVNVVGSSCDVSSSAQAFVLNATVVPPGPLGFLALWPDGQAQPLVSTLNSYDGAVSSNMAIVPTMNGSIDAFASNMTQLILDISSYFAP